MAEHNGETSKRIEPDLIEQVAQSLSLDKIATGSARLLVYLIAAATIYSLTEGDTASVAAWSPVLGRLIDKLGGNVMANMLERVAQRGSRALDEDDVIEIVLTELEGLGIEETLSEREFYRAASRLQKQHEEKYRALQQSLHTVQVLLRRTQPADPAPISPIPKTARPLIDMPLVGRDADIEWLIHSEGDLLLIGQPGIGKTFLLYKYTLGGFGLFVNSDDRGEIAMAINETRPDNVIVDDAHVHRELLADLQYIRRTSGGHFSIIASSWPGDANSVAELMQLADDKIRKLKPLDRDQLVAVVNYAGISGPIGIVREIVDQAHRRPGLAVTLTQLLIDMGGRQVFLGDALRRTVLDAEPLGGERDATVLGAFSVGGNSGISPRVVAGLLTIELVTLKVEVSRFAAAGILFENDGGLLCVQPRALREALVRDTFFGEMAWWDIRYLLERSPSAEDSAMTLIGACHRGATVPIDLLIEQLERANSIRAWIRFAALGPEQKEWVLNHHPESVVLLSRESILVVPEQSIPLFLEAAIGDDRPTHASPSHPLRIIEDWIKSALPNTREVLQRRKILLQNCELWLRQGRDKEVGFRALRFVTSPRYEDFEVDAGTGDSVMWSSGIVSRTDIDEIGKLWPDVFQLMLDVDIQNWEPVKSMVTDWLDAPMFVQELTVETANALDAQAERILNDILMMAQDHQGILRWGIEISQRANFEAEIEIEDDFLVLFPIHSIQTDYESTQAEWLSNVRRLAQKWSKESPDQVARKLSLFEYEANLADIRWPRLTRLVCESLANLVANPAIWKSEFISHGLESVFVEPFIEALEQGNRSVSSEKPDET